MSLDVEYVIKNYGFLCPKFYPYSGADLSELILGTYESPEATEAARVAKQKIEYVLRLNNVTEYKAKYKESKNEI